MTVETLPEQAIARFPVCLGLPGASPSLVSDAAEAVRQEYRNSIRWKRLRCRKVSPVTGEPGETVFVIEVGHSIQFDWTWEGAVAFRPGDISGFRGDADITDDFLVSDDESNTSVWAAAPKAPIMQLPNGKDRRDHLTDFSLPLSFRSEPFVRHPTR